MWLSIVDTQPAPPIDDNRPPALQQRVRLVKRHPTPGLQKPRHHQRRALASFLAMHQHAMPLFELVVDQCRSLFERHDSLRQERHVNSLRRLALRHIRQHADNRPAKTLRVLQIPDEQPRNYLALLPARRHWTVQLDGPTDIASTSRHEPPTTAYRRAMVRRRARAPRH